MPLSRRDIGRIVKRACARAGFDREVVHEFAGAGWFTVTVIDGVAKTATLHNQGHAGAIITLQA